ncbi:MAG: leucine-rich repeat domain-containing protein [Anaerolineae bacterium]
MNKPEGAISIAEAEAVTSLDLSSSGPWAPGEEKIKDISALAHFKNLDGLNLAWNDVSDLSPLAGLTKLQGLSLFGSANVTDFSPLAGLTNMLDLVITGNQHIDDASIGFTANMTQLQILWIEDAPGLTDISLVSGMPDLQKLVLMNCGVQNVGPIAGLTKLKELYLKGNPISDLSLLEGTYGQLEGKDFEILSAESVPDEPIEIADENLLAALQEALDIHDREITQRDAFMVTSLDLSKEWVPGDIPGQISDITPLQYFANLKDLKLTFNALSDIGALSGLVTLESLDIGGNNIGDNLESLSGLTNLKQLSMFGNRTTDISALAGLTNLELLYIHSNQISDISPLANLKNLSELMADDNQISDVSALSGLHMTRLHLAKNPVADFSPLIDMYPNLQDKDFELE